MKKSPKTMHTAYPVGMMCTVGKPCLGNPAGCVAVVYESYKLGDHHGVSLLFPNGNYDGFSERCLEALDVTPFRFNRSLCNYEFVSVGKLADDFQRGLFANALSKK